MAFSQVEIVSPQNFGCVLRDRNQRHDSVFGKNMKSLVKDHHNNQLLNRVSAASESSDENSRNRIETWIENQQKQNRNICVRSVSDSSKQSTCVIAADKNCPKDPSNLPALPPRKNFSRRAKNENSKRNENLGASSLVQIWEARLNRSNGGTTTSQTQSTVSSSSRSNSGLSVLESYCSGPSVSEESESSADEREDSRNNNADETENQPKNSDPAVEIETGISSSGGRGSGFDSGESKWVRVADIIRRLSNEQRKAAGKDNNAGRVHGLPIIRTSKPSYDNSSCSSSVSDRMSEESSFRRVNCSPRLRGRQAFSDLLMQLERDRHRELDSLLERKAVSKFPQRGRLQSMLRLRNFQRCQAIQDRHRANANVTRPETGSAVLNLRDKFRANFGNGTAAEQKKEDGDLLEKPSANRRLNPPKAEEEATLCKTIKFINGETRTKMSCLHTQETTETEDLNAKSKVEGEDEAILISPKENCAQDSFLGSLVYNSEQQDDQYRLDHQETAFLNGWEEEKEYEDEQSCYDETNYDWYSEISRPRSYWEDLRKHRYIEVMNTTRSGKEEIQRLLERRTVSDFLESELREKIDRLMMSRVQAQPKRRIDERTNKWDKWELPQEDEEEEEGEDKDEDKAGEEHEEDDSSQSSSPVFSPSPGRSWSSQDPEIGPTTPVNNHPSGVSSLQETELVNDLREQIEQLKREMSLLRNSVKTCMEVNAHLQQSVQRDSPLKRKCCVCNEMQVESVLYRCGHMCACLKCAHELQWNSGKCPICRAKILDVVRVIVDPSNN